MNARSTVLSRFRMPAGTWGRNMGIWLDIIQRSGRKLRRDSNEEVCWRSKAMGH